MRMEDVDARRNYIKNVRDSFDSPRRRYEFEQEKDTKGEAEEGFSFFKVRLFLAALLFAAYVYCDRSGTVVQGYSAKDIVQEIAREINYEKAGEEALQVFHRMLEK